MGLIAPKVKTPLKTGYTKPVYQNDYVIQSNLSCRIPNVTRETYATSKICIKSTSLYNQNTI